jgi:hypothetical protein
MLYLSELRYTFWAMLHLTEPRGTLLSYAAPYWATGHSTELRCTLLKYALLTKLCCALLSWGAPPYELAHPNLSTLHPTELRWTLLSYAVLYWAMQHHVSYTKPKWATFRTRTFVQFCQMPECRTVRYRNKGSPVWYRNKGSPVRYQNARVPDWDAGWMLERRCLWHRPLCRCPLWK